MRGCLSLVAVAAVGVGQAVLEIAFQAQVKAPPAVGERLAAAALHGVAVTEVVARMGDERYVGRGLGEL